MWLRNYLLRLAVADGLCASIAVIAALQVRFGGTFTRGYELLSLALPPVWVVVLWLAGGYEQRFIGTGSDEFRKVLNVGVSLTAAIAILSYAADAQLSRGYLLVAMPSLTALDLCLRYLMRKRLHRRRLSGDCMVSVVAVGHEPGLTALITELAREPHHGMRVVAACVAEGGGYRDIAGVPVLGGLEDVPTAVRRCGANTVAVQACPEMDAVRLRRLAWDLEKTGTDLCVAPALLDVAGPRTTVRSAAGLTLLHVDHPQLSGPRRIIKGIFDRCTAVIALVALSPVLLALAIAIKLSDNGPALFSQTRVGKDGRSFRIFKFRTMVVDAEQRRAELVSANEHDGILFKIRADPRITAIGMWLRRYSLDEFPQLLNVVLGEMSLVGPRPALPDEAKAYPEHVRRRLVVKPGLTGLWQVNGRSDLSWDESVRLDLRYVENWSFALDLQILWKTFSAIFGGTGAY